MIDTSNSRIWLSLDRVVDEVILHVYTAERNNDRQYQQQIISRRTHRREQGRIYTANEYPTFARTTLIVSQKMRIA